MRLDDFKAALLRGSHAALFEVDWLHLVDQMSSERPSGDLAERFHTQWVTHGAKIRLQVSDDAKLAEVLRQWLPPYSGGPLRLFRGESASRYEAGHLGLCWTTDRDIAEMFASGLNAVRPNGGVLLEAEVPARAVIAAPGAHSRYLGEEEYTVDPSQLGAVRLVACYGPADRRPERGTPGVTGPQNGQL